VRKSKLAGQKVMNLFGSAELKRLPPGLSHLANGAMLTVVVSNNLIQLLVGWEVMGVCSYLLIGHWWEVKENSDAAIKAFITTRIGDIPFMFGIIMLIAVTGFTTTNIREIGEIIGVVQPPGEFLRLAKRLQPAGDLGLCAPEA